MLIEIRHTAIHDAWLNIPNAIIHSCDILVLPPINVVFLFSNVLSYMWVIDLTSPSNYVHTCINVLDCTPKDTPIRMFNLIHCKIHLLLLSTLSLGDLLA